MLKLTETLFFKHLCTTPASCSWKSHLLSCFLWLMPWMSNPFQDVADLTMSSKLMIKPDDNFENGSEHYNALTLCPLGLRMQHLSLNPSKCFQCWKGKGWLRKNFTEKLKRDPSFFSSILKVLQLYICTCRMDKSDSHWNELCFDWVSENLCKSL